jgi:hypothetical protein
MTLEEIREAKASAEKQIVEILEQFDRQSKKAGVQVADIKVNIYEYDSDATFMAGWRDYQVNIIVQV